MSSLEGRTRDTTSSPLDLQEYGLFPYLAQERGGNICSACFSHKGAPRGFVAGITIPG